MHLLPGIVINPPGLALGVTTFRNSLTFSIGYGEYGNATGDDGRVHGQTNRLPARGVIARRLHCGETELPDTLLVLMHF